MTGPPLFLQFSLRLCENALGAGSALVQLTQQHSQTSEQSGKSLSELKLLDLAQAVANSYFIKSFRKRLCFVPKPQIRLSCLQTFG